MSRSNRPVRRDRQAGLTLLEVMISCAILAIMMALAWRTIASTNTAKRTYTSYEERNQELRMAMRRVVADFSAAYLSQNDNPNLASTYPRTMFVARPGDRVPDIHFSTLGHRTLWADANESEQTVISYLTRRHLDESGASTGGTDWIRREQRRLSNENPEQEPADYDVLLPNVEKVELGFWNWHNDEWQDTWDTTQADGQRNQLPSRVRIRITVKDATGKDVTLETQARIQMQESLNFTP